MDFWWEDNWGQTAAKILVSTQNPSGGKREKKMRTDGTTLFTYKAEFNELLTLKPPNQMERNWMKLVQVDVNKSLLYWKHNVSPWVCWTLIYTFICYWPHTVSYLQNIWAIMWLYMKTNTGLHHVVKHGDLSLNFTFFPPLEKKALIKILFSQRIINNLIKIIYRPLLCNAYIHLCVQVNNQWGKTNSTFMRVFLRLNSFIVNKQNAVRVLMRNLNLILLL